MEITIQERLHCLATRILPLFDDYKQFSKRLGELGYVDFTPAVDHLDSFANSERELDDSWRVRAEQARRNFWGDCLRSAGFFVRNGPPPPPFEGKWLDEMIEMAAKKEAKTEADFREGVSRLYNEIDICWRRRKQWSDMSFENWRYCTAGLVAEQLKLRDRLAESGLVTVPDVHDEHVAIQNFVAEKMLYELKDKSIKRIEKSRKNTVTLSKKLRNGLELRFLFHTVDCSFSQFGRIRIGKQGEWYAQPNLISLSLFVKTKQFSANDDRSRGLMIELPYFYLAPLGLYGCYRNAAHMAVALGGWAALYRLVAAQIEEACNECLA